MIAHTSPVNADREAAARARLLARLARWAEERRHASLAFCLALFATQMAGGMLLFMVAYGAKGAWVAPAAFLLRAVLLLLPLGSLVGIYLATRTPPAHQGHPVQVLGILANGAYLVYGLYIWSLVLADLAA